MQSVAVEKDAQRLRPAAEQPAQVRLPLFDGGVRTDKAPADLAPNELMELKSLHVVAGRLVVDTGYVPFGGPYLGTAQGTFEAFFADGSSVLLLFTTTTVYKYNPAALQWQVVSLNSIRTTTAGYAAGATAFALNSVANIIVGTLVGIVLDNGVQLITTVTGISSLTITTAAAVPVGRTVANGADVFVAVALLGDVQKSQISAVVFPGNNWIIFSNGVSPVMYYLLDVVKPLPGLPATTTCGAIAVFHETVLLANTTEGGTHLPHRVRQSDAGDPANWTTGIAAIYDLLDTDDTILNLSPLGPWMIAYREASIMRASYLGVLNEILFWEYMTQLEGAQSQGAVVNVGGEHVFVGHAGIYAYQGGYTLDSIGDGVFNNFLAAMGDFNVPARATLFTVFVPDLDEVWVVYPSGRSATPNKLLRVQLENNSWSERMFADSVVAGSSFLPFSMTSWASAAGQWNSTQWARPWDSRSLVQNIPSILLSPAVAGGGATQLLLYEYRAQTDNGAPITWSLVTKQLGDGAQFARWETVNVVAVGASVLVQMSEDEGATWRTIGTFSFGAVGAPSATRVPVDRVSTRCQLRMSGTDPAFQLRYMTVHSIAESEW
jgi:hypothetical protein